jgi:hypothetical protein
LEDETGAGDRAGFVLSLAPCMAGRLDVSRAAAK